MKLLYAPADATRPPAWGVFNDTISLWLSSIPLLKFQDISCIKNKVRYAFFKNQTALNLILSGLSFEGAGGLSPQGKRKKKEKKEKREKEKKRRKKERREL